MLSTEELSAIDEFRFSHRMPTRAAAVRELLNRGLANGAAPVLSERKSSSYGILDDEPD
jgi:hypothetical protein